MYTVHRRGSASFWAPYDATENEINEAILTQIEVLLVEMKRGSRLGASGLPDAVLPNPPVRAPPPPIAAATPFALPFASRLDPPPHLEKCDEESFHYIRFA